MTTLERRAPMRELDRMERRVRRLFEETGLFAAGPATDIYETSDEFVVQLDVPGFEEQELSVEVADHTLVVKGERTVETDTQDRTVLLRERLEHEFVRRLELPFVADGEHVTAGFAKGVLTLHVPKTTDAKLHRVAIAST